MNKPWISTIVWFDRCLTVLEFVRAVLL